MAAMADSFITSPSWPVTVRWPSPGMAVASMKRMSPPTGVQARPVATPGSLVRRLTSAVIRGRPSRSCTRFTVNVKRVHDLLGRPRMTAEVKRRTSDPGVATGLAWTPVGGDILFIEATAMPGDGHLTVTGQLGDVMKESAMAAMSYVRTHSRELGLADDYFQVHDIHIHVPAGAIPKDGPSAGVPVTSEQIAVAIVTPALGPSLGIAPAGTWMWISCTWK